MSNLISVADAIKREAKRCEAFIEAAKVLERIGSFEQAEEDAKRRHAVATAAATAAQEKLRLAEEAVRQAEVRGQERLALAAAEASALMAKAEERGMLKVSQAEAQALLMSAKVDAQCKVVMQQVLADAAAMRAKTVEAEQALADVKAAITERSVELSRIELKLTAAREAVAKMLR